MERVRMAVIGAGIWGENHAVALSTYPIVDLVCICDLDARRAKALAEWPYFLPQTYVLAMRGMPNATSYTFWRDSPDATVTVAFPTRRGAEDALALAVAQVGWRAPGWTPTFDIAGAFVRTLRRKAAALGTSFG